MLKELEEIRKGFVIMAGDFHLVMAKEKYKSNPTKAGKLIALWFQIE